MPITMVKWGLGMNLRIFALLFGIAALTGTTGTSHACSVNNFNVPALGVIVVACNPAPQQVAKRSNDNLITGPSILSWVDKIKAVLNPRNIEERCLARAVYFEARSESQWGQLAVATVVLNRVRAPRYPSTICGVVYQGASHSNACQFSFACDGQPDIPKQGRAWDSALAIAGLALANDNNSEDWLMRTISAATHYHADYVTPGWSKSLQRLTKIGHHIFYSQG